MKLTTLLPRCAALLLLLCGSAAAFAQADLRLLLTQRTAQPTRYTSYTVTATVTNAGPTAASNVAVSVPLPAGVVFTGGREATASQGSFSPYGSQVWEVGTLAANRSATLTINVFLLAPTAPAYYAQVLRSSAPDPDSRPGNGTPPSVNEDDEASTTTSGPVAAAPCDLKVTLGSVSCINDNRTPNDPSDDYFIAKVQATSPLRGDGQAVNLTLSGITVGITSLTGTFEEVALPARLISGGTFVLTAAYDTQIACKVAVSGRVPSGCPTVTAGCGFDKTFAGVVFPSTKLASQVGNNYVIESAGQRLTIAADGTSATTGNTALLNSNVTFNTQPLANGTRYRLQFIGGATPTLKVEVLAANGSVLTTLNLPAASALASLGDVTISDFTTYAGQYVVTGTATLPGATGRQVVVARGSLVAGDFALSQLDALVPGAPKTYSSIMIAAVSQSGDVYLEAATASGYDLAKVSASGRLIWGRTVVSGLNAGNVAYDTEISPDATKLYVGSKEGSRLLLRTLNTANGAEVGMPFDISANAITTDLQATSTSIGGVLPLVGGNVLISYGGTAAGGRKSELLWVAPNRTAAKKLDISGTVGGSASALNPVLETKSGELVFTSATPAGLRVVQLRSDGSATPNCGSGATQIDLELSVASASASPRRYTTNAVTYTLTNRGSLAATGVTVSVPNFTGAVLAGGNEFTASQGSYSSYGSQVWTVGTLAPGATATLQLNYFGLAANGYTSYGQVATANERDSDSTPGNGTVGTAREDDEASVSVGESLRGAGTSAEYLRMYPNPAITGQSITFALDIPVETSQSAEIIVSDLAGRVVARRKVELNGSTTQLTLDLGGIPSGVYVAAVPELELEPQRLIISE